MQLDGTNHLNVFIFAMGEVLRDKMEVIGREGHLIVGKEVEKD